MYQQAENILIVLGELGFVIIIFCLFNFLLVKSFQQAMKISWLGQEESQADSLRRQIQFILVFVCVLLCLLIVGANSYIIFYEETNIKEYTLNITNQIHEDFWINLGWITAKCLLVILVASQAIKLVKYVLNKIHKTLENYDRINVKDPNIESFFSLLDKSVTNIIWPIALAQCALLIKLPEIVAKNIYLIVKIYAIVVIGLLIVKAAAAIIDSLDSLIRGYLSDDKKSRFYNRLRHLIPFFERCLEYAIYVTTATLVTEQIEAIARLARYGPDIVQIVGIIFLSRVFIEVAKLLVEEILLRSNDLTELERQRRLTIIPLIQSALKYLIYFSAGVAILYTIEIDATPILAGAGLLGLAVSLGAQGIVNDVVNGFFILFENYYLVGDFIETNGASGFVEAIELRTTRIRNPAGHVYIVRNGDVAKIVNYSKTYVYAVVQVGVDYDSNLDKVYRIIEEVGKQLQQVNPDVVEPTRVDGLDNFGESDLTIRTVTKVKPGKHLPVQRVFRKMLKSAFDREGIEIPFARRVLIFKNESDSNPLSGDRSQENFQG
ncbi:MAG: mechanosensitive ion channel family protein [Prochloraceae cyanobacterium]|nr:mechanosensitive ion channel family protein [Prochloraceae cyanobacterium]